MSVVSNTFQTFDAKGIREDLSNVIFRISQEETPVVANLSRRSAKQTLVEWQTDTLAAADTTNAQLAGDDITSFDALVATKRVGNHMQISRKVYIIEDTLEATDRAGRGKESAYQLMLKGLELKRDMEAITMSNQGGDAGSISVARQTATLGAWLQSNTSKGASGLDPVYTSGVPGAARTDGTQRAFTETLLQDVTALMYTNGAKLRSLYVGSFNKRALSAFAGVVTRNFDMSNVSPSPTAVIAAVDVYVDDFGTLKVIPDAFQRDRDAYLLDHEFLGMDVLRPMKLVELAKTGDAEKFFLRIEWGLRVRNEAAHGLVADLTVS